jgi:FkbM family methyltransferase
MGIVEKARFMLGHFREQRHPCRAALVYVLAKFGLARCLPAFRHSGIRLGMRNGGLAPFLWSNPGHRLDGEIFLASFLKEGDVVVDVGANIGVLALLASRKVGSAGRVLAIEAHPGTHAALLENLRLNAADNVTAVQTAVGPGEATVRFSDKPGDDWNRVEANSGAIEVKQTTLDSVCQGCAKIDLLKMDIEGFELPALKGAAETLGKTECVLIECWDTNTKSFGYGAGEVVEHLVQAGFSGHLLDEAGDGSSALRPVGLRREFPNLENCVFVRHPSTLARPGIRITG